MIRTSLRLLTVAGAATLAACNLDNSGPSAEDSAINLAVAQSSGQAVANDLSVNPGLTSEATGTGTFLSVDGLSSEAEGSAFSRQPAGCNLLAGAFPKFRCGRSQRRGGPGGMLGDRDFERTISYFDAAGTAQTGYDTLTTARIVFEVADTGSYSRTRGGSSKSDSSARSRVATLSNLVGHPDTLHIWNGVASGYHRSTMTTAAGTRTHEMISSDTTTNLRYRLPRATNRYPVSGTIIRNVSVTRVRTPTDSAGTTVNKTRRVVIEFNGTSTATMTVNGEVFDLDLDTGEVTPRA
ncbi:MAG: hypothetical protein SFW08_11885 [Gemmatimonadaceae bacterium]|nr:hypothetical protein [Gemmatimonadaceae bacterium]